MKLLLTLLAISSSAHALTLADYPSMFFTPEFNATIILPDFKDPNIAAASNYLVKNLPEYTVRLGRNKTHATSTAVRTAIINASEPNQPGPTIVIGTPCNNKHITRALPTIPCTAALESDTARIILREGPLLAITADTTKYIPLAIRYLHENAIQHHGQEIHLHFEQQQVHAIIYKATDAPAYSIRDNNGTTRSDHAVRRRRYGTTIKS